MKPQNLTLVTLGCFLLFSLGLQGQSDRTKFTELFTTMHKEQLKVAKGNKFTKAEVAAIDKAMATAGAKINRAIDATPGKTPQYLVDQIKNEFRTLNTQLGNALSGDKLTAFRKVTNTHKSKILNNLQMQYLNADSKKHTEILAGIKDGIKGSLIRGFGGDDPGW